MTDGGHAVASHGHEGAPGDPDAPWRPSGRTLLAERDDRPRPRPRRGRVSAMRLRRLSLESPPSPWSREAVEAPLPTIDQIRTRWRRELGLDDTARRPSNGGTAGTGTPSGPAGALAHSPAARAGSDVAPRSTVTGDRVLAGLVVAVVVVGSLLVARALVPPPSPRMVAASPLPASATRAWQIDLGLDIDGGAGAYVAVGGGVVAAVTPDALRTFDVRDGASRWTRAFVHGGDPVGVEIYGDVIVTVEATTRTVNTLSAFDAVDGTVLWTRRAPFSSVALLPGTPIEYSGPTSTTELRAIDPTTGNDIGHTAAAVKLRSPDHYVIGRRDADVQLFDLRAGRWIRPAVGGFGLRSIATVGEHLVGLTDSSDIVLYDGDRVALDQRAFVSDMFGDFNGRAELVGAVPGTEIGIVASGSSIGFDTASGSIDLAWEVPGRVGTPTDTLVGPVAVARVVDRGTGEVDHSLVDVTDGTTIVVTDVGVTREAPPIVAADGYIVAPVVGDRTRTITAHDFDGTERWELPLDPGAEFRLVEGTLYAVGADGTIAAYR